MSLGNKIKSRDVKIGVVGPGDVRLSLAVELTSIPVLDTRSVTNIQTPSDLVISEDK